MTEINPGAVGLAAASSVLLAAAWYAPGVFGARRGTTGGGGGCARPGLRRWIAIAVFSAISATAFALWLGPAPAMERALLRGGVAGFGFVAASLGMQYQLERRSLAAWSIDGGYQLARFMLFALILGAWR